MTYEKEIREVYTQCLRRPWMNDEDFEEVISEMHKESGVTWESLTNDINIGIRNGFSLELQLGLIVKAMK